MDVEIYAAQYRLSTHHWLDGSRRANGGRELDFSRAGLRASMARDAGNRGRHLVDSTLMNLLRLIIRRFDNWLSQVEGVEPFTDDPQCILRIQIGHINHRSE